MPKKPLPRLITGFPRRPETFAHGTYGSVAPDADIVFVSLKISRRDKTVLLYPPRF